MTLKEKLEQLFESVEAGGVADEFEKLGVHDHDSMRAFGQTYGNIIGALCITDKGTIGPEDIGATVVGGILLGLMLAESGYLEP